MTRPRNSSVTMVWMMVFVAASVTIMPAPTKGNASNDVQIVRDNANAMRPAPNMVVDTSITRPSPRTLLRDAR